MKREWPLPQERQIIKQDSETLFALALLELRFWSEEDSIMAKVHRPIEYNYIRCRHLFRTSPPFDMLFLATQVDTG
jgi:hypothetical protein